MSIENEPERQRYSEVRKLAVQGAVSGLFFAQTVSWQQLVDAIVVNILGVASDGPWYALWKAVVVTVLTTMMAWGVLVATRRCT